MKSQDATKVNDDQEMEIPVEKDEPGKLSIQDAYPVDDALREDLKRVREEIKEEFRKEFRGLNPFLTFLTDPPDQLLEALCSAQLEYNPVKMSSVNTYFNNSPYSNMDDIIAATRKALAKHELVFMHIPDISPHRGESMLLTVLYHIPSKQNVFAKYSIKGADDPPIKEIEGAKTRNRSHAIGADLTYAMRQLLRALAGIPYGDEQDGNENTDRLPDDRQQNRNQNRNQSSGRQPGSKRRESSEGSGGSGRKQSASEKKAWAIATFLKIDKKTLEERYTKKYEVRDIKELKPGQWQEIGNSLGKLQTQIRDVAKHLNIPVELIVGYVAETSTWKDFTVCAGKVLANDKAVEESMMQALSVYKEAKEKEASAKKGKDKQGQPESAKDKPQAGKEASEEAGTKKETPPGDSMPNGSDKEADDDVPF